MIPVLKLGGGNFPEGDTIKALAQVPEIIKAQKKETNGNAVIVVSAFGKNTNLLCELVAHFFAGERDEWHSLIKKFYRFHLQLASQLFKEDQSHMIFQAIGERYQMMTSFLITARRKKYEQAFVMDQILPFGELLSTLIVSEYLKSVGHKNILMDASDFIITDNKYGEANVNTLLTEKNIKEQMNAEIFATEQIIVTQGFIGSTIFRKNRVRTTLGREGSDYTAAIIAAALDAPYVTLFKNVPGIMDKNPNIPGNEDAVLLEHLSYSQCQELLEGPAQGIVHPKTLTEVERKHIPLHIKSFWQPKQTGTMIQ